MATLDQICGEELAFLTEEGFRVVDTISQPDVVTFANDESFLRLSWDLRDRALYVSVGPCVERAVPYPPQPATHFPLQAILRDLGVEGVLPLMEVADLRGSVAAVGNVLRGRGRRALLDDPSTWKRARHRALEETLALEVSQLENDSLVPLWILSLADEPGYPSLGSHQYGVRPERVAILRTSLILDGELADERLWLERLRAAIGPLVSPQDMTVHRASVEGKEWFVLVEVSGRRTGRFDLDEARRMEAVADTLRAVLRPGERVVCTTSLAS